MDEKGADRAAEGMLAGLSVIELLRLHAAVLDELIGRGAVRTRNNPVADYAEDLVCRALSLDRARKSARGHDAEGKDRKRYEIKSRRESGSRRTSLTSPIRDVDKEHFDELVIVLFAEDYTVKHAVQFRREHVSRIGRFRKHVNGWVIPIRDSLWDDPEGVDITGTLRRCQRKL